jgi:ketosteroid isomerase-like protein
MICAMYEALNRRDARGSLEYLHPDAELHQSPEIPDSGTYIGRDEFARGIALWLDGWKELRFEPQEATEEEGFVVMRVRVWGIGKHSGIEAEHEFHHVWTVRDGLAHRCVVRSTRERALEDARRLL